MIKGVIFDVDGVIINTENTHFQAFRTILKKHNYNLTYNKYKTHFSGRSIKGGLLSLLTETPIADPDDKKFQQDFANQKISSTVELFKKQVVFFDDALLFIKQLLIKNLSLKGIGKIQSQPKLAMVTGLENILMTEVLKYHNLKKIFSVVVSADEYNHSKPHPECYNIALQKMNISSNHAIGIEDSLSGVQALNRAGIFSIGLTNTHSAHELSEAKIVTASLTELIE